MQEKRIQESYKLKCKEIKYKVNEEKGTVTAIETVEVPYPISMFDTYQFTVAGVAKVNKEAGEVFDVEIGKKVARAKAEKEAFIEFKKLVLDYRNISVIAFRR